LSSANKNIYGFFITGTGTNIGKTYVCKTLCEKISKNVPVSYFKPVQTGGRVINGRLQSPDFLYVKKSNVLTLTKEKYHVPYLFKHACSPHLAAKLEKKNVSLEYIKHCFNKICSIKKLQNNGCILIEGAGGVYVPISKNMNFINIIKLFPFPVIVVSVPDLGTLNHTLLTLKALNDAKIKIAALVINNINNYPCNYIYKDNICNFKKNIKKALLLELKYNHIDNKNVEEFCNELTKRYF